MTPTPVIVGGPTVNFEPILDAELPEDKASAASDALKGKE